MARQVHEGAMLGVNELRLRGHVAGVLHGAGRVDHAHLQQRHNGGPNAEADTQFRTGRGQRRPSAAWTGAGERTRGVGTQTPLQSLTRRTSAVASLFQFVLIVFCERICPRCTGSDTAGPPPSSPRPRPRGRARSSRSFPLKLSPFGSGQTLVSSARKSRWTHLELLWVPVPRPQGPSGNGAAMWAPEDFRGRVPSGHRGPSHHHGLGRRQPCLGLPRIGGPHLGQRFTHSRAAVYSYEQPPPPWPPL